MKLLALLILVLLLAIPLVANAQEPPIDDTASTPEVNYFDMVEAWVKSSLLILIMAAVAVSESVSGVKTAFLAPARDRYPFMQLEIVKGVTIYQVAVVGLVFIGGIVTYQLQLNPFENSPIEQTDNLPELAQAFVSVIIVTYLASISHEARTGLTNWASRQKAKG